MTIIATIMMLTGALGLYIQKRIIQSKVRVLDVKGEVRDLYRRERREWQLAQLTPLNRALYEAQYCLDERKILKDKTYARLAGVNAENMSMSPNAEKHARQM